MYAVSYPAACSAFGKLGRSLGYSVKLLSTLCECAYSPLRIDARLGEQREVVQNVFLKWTPSRASRSMLRVFSCGWPAQPRQSQRRSSQRMNKTFGRSAAVPTARARPSARRVTRTVRRDMSAFRVGE